MSRLKSPAAKANPRSKPATRGATGRGGSVRVPSAHWSVYETLLSVSLAALLIGIVLLALLLNSYEFQLSP